MEVQLNTPGLQRIPGIEIVRRMASFDRFQTAKRTPQRTSLSYIHYKFSSEYRKRRRLCIQNRSGGCILSSTNQSRKQEVPSPRLSVVSYVSVPGAFLCAPRANSIGLPPLSRDIGYSLCRRLVS